MKAYKYLNTGRIVTMEALIQSGEIGDKETVQIFRKDGTFITKGSWFKDNILSYTQATGIATKPGTGLTVNFRLAEEPKKTMNIVERVKMVKAMEFIIRNINDESIINHWLATGVADGDIAYGNLDVDIQDTEELDYYTDETTFANLMHTFLSCIADAKKDGGLYCDGVVSKEAEE